MLLPPNMSTVPSARFGAKRAPSGSSQTRILAGQHNRNNTQSTVDALDVMCRYASEEVRERVVLSFCRTGLLQRIPSEGSSVELDLPVDFFRVFGSPSRFDSPRGFLRGVDSASGFSGGFFQILPEDWVYPEDSSRGFLQRNPPRHSSRGVPQRSPPVDSARGFLQRR